MPAFAIQTMLSSRSRGHRTYTQVVTASDEFSALELALLKSRGIACEDDICEVTRDRSYVVEIVT